MGASASFLARSSDIGVSSSLGNKITSFAKYIYSGIRNLISPLEWFGDKVHGWIDAKALTVDMIESTVKKYLAKAGISIARYIINRGDDILFATIMGGQSIHIIFGVADYLITGKSFVFMNTYNYDPWSMAGAYL